MNDVVIIGGDAAGMMAAAAVLQAGGQVRLYEKNEKLGKKLYITGKGRCNLTNACGTEELFDKVVRNPKFLYSGFYGFTNFQVMAFMEENGCPVKVERGNRVFPVSDKSSDVIRALSGYLSKGGAQVYLEEEVLELVSQEGRITGVVLKKGRRFIPARAVVVATGGLSYPSTGSTGDGYRFAGDLGHKVTELTPALVPFSIREAEVAQALQGLSLRNVNIRVLNGGKVLFEGFGEMLFTHYGVSGPLLLSASSFAAKAIQKGPLALSIDLKPALPEEQLDARIVRDFQERKNKRYQNALDQLLPARLIPVVVEASGVSPEKQVNEITQGERRQIVKALKDFRLTLTKLRGYQEAVITQGGVSVKDVNPSTMESKKVRGLYFAGEVLDLDAVTGGFNLQIAWSTGYLAGDSV